MPAVNLPAVHATVRSFVPATRSGTVLLDDGVELPFDAAAFDAGGVRLLRVGQRVRLRVQPSTQESQGIEAAPRIVLLTIATLPDPL
jgi:2-phospho-L-lactate/phosphoenolpyruvate guanylyltransferase